MYPKRRLCWRRLAIRFLPGQYSFLPSFLSKQNIVAAEAETDNTNNSLSIATCIVLDLDIRQRGLLSISNLLQPIHLFIPKEKQIQTAQRSAAASSAAASSATQCSAKQRSAAPGSAAQRSSTYSATCKAERSAAPHKLRLEATCIYSAVQRSPVYV